MKGHDHATYFPMVGKKRERERERKEGRAEREREEKSKWGRGEC